LPTLAWKKESPKSSDRGGFLYHGSVFQISAEITVNWPVNRVSEGGRCEKAYSAEKIAQAGNRSDKQKNRLSDRKIGMGQLTGLIGGAASQPLARFQLPPAPSASARTSPLLHALLSCSSSHRRRPPTLWPVHPTEAQLHRGGEKQGDDRCSV
jgi:hypothetical protein